MSIRAGYIGDTLPDVVKYKQEWNQAMLYEGGEDSERESECKCPVRTLCRVVSEAKRRPPHL
jgi:hypothetical protein